MGSCLRLVVKAFFIISISSLMILLTSGIATARIHSPIIINGTIYPEVAINENEIVTINMTNIGDLPVKEIDVQVFSQGFKIISEKKWPDTVYAHSSVIGQYILQPIHIGTYAIYITATYLTNDTTIHPSELKQMNLSVKVGEAKVQSDLSSSFFIATWLQHPLILIIIGGILTGILAPRIVNQRENHQKKLQIAVDIIIKISKGHAEIDYSLLKSKRKIEESANILSIKTKGGIQKQIEELRIKSKQLEEQKNKAVTGEENNVYERELKEISDQIEIIKKVEEDLDISINKSDKAFEEWIISNREIASLTRTFYYRNWKIEEYYTIYYQSITKFQSSIHQYYNNVKEFSISNDLNKLDSLLRNINGISNNAIIKTQSLIDLIREETFTGRFQRFLTNTKNKIHKDPNNKKIRDELDEDVIP